MSKGVEITVHCPECGTDFQAPLNVKLVDEGRGVEAIAVSATCLACRAHLLIQYSEVKR